MNTCPTAIWRPTARPDSYTPARPLASNLSSRDLRRRIMTSTSLQDKVCEFVREIIAARTGELISIASRPDLDRQNDKAVEELWDAPSCGYAVEHTRVESFDGQLANIAKIKRLLSPVKEMLAGRLPGYYVLAVREDQTTAARVGFAFAHREVERLVLEAAERLVVGETVTLRSERLSVRTARITPRVPSLETRRSPRSGLALAMKFL